MRTCSFVPIKWYGKSQLAWHKTGGLWANGVPKTPSHIGCLVKLMVQGDDHFFSHGVLWHFYSGRWQELVWPELEKILIGLNNNIRNFCSHSFQKKTAISESSDKILATYGCSVVLSVVFSLLSGVAGELRVVWQLLQTTEGGTAGSRAVRQPQFHIEMVLLVRELWASDFCQSTMIFADGSQAPLKLLASRALE